MTPFYNDNANRQYPFVNEGAPEMTYSGGGTVELPDSAVVDFSCLVNLPGGFAEDTHRVYLYEVVRAGGLFTFRFRFTAPSIVGYELEFCHALGDGEFSVSRAEANELIAGSASLDLTCGGDIVEGWLTTGSLDALAAVLADGEYLRRADGEIWIEPAQIQNLQYGFMRTANLANEDRTHATDPCASLSLSDDGSLILNTQCMIGDIRWKEGYNCSIEQESLDNELVITAREGAGQGDPCDEVPLFDGETAPSGSKLLTGGPACDEVIKTINGVGGSFVQFLSGTGITILPDDTEPNTLIIDANLHGLAVCPPSSASI
jgi:hypothetical protein